MDKVIIEIDGTRVDFLAFLAVQINLLFAI